MWMLILAGIFLLLISVLGFSGLIAQSLALEIWKKKNTDYSPKNLSKNFLPIGSEVLLRTLEKGKYGRYLGDFKRYDKWLCAELIRHHHAVEYFGQSKHAIKQAHLENRKKIV